MIGRIQAGDHVDVLSGFQVQPDGAARPRPMLRTLLQNVEVLQAPPPTSPTSSTASMTAAQTQNVVLKVPEKTATELAFASDNGKVWLILRPQAGAAQSRMSLVTLDRVLLGMDPIPVDKFLAKKRSLITKIYQGQF
jgi:Flp pilus assembly protein CpaB